MRANAWGTARTERPRGGRFASIAIVSVLGIALHLTETQTLRAVAEARPAVAPEDSRAVGGEEPPSRDDYIAVAALRGGRPTLVGVALARIRGDAQELVLGVCGLDPDRTYRLLIDGRVAASLAPSEAGVVNVSLSSRPDGTGWALPDDALPVSRVRRVEIVAGGGDFVVSGELRAVTARAATRSPRAAAAEARGRQATATP